MVPTLTPTPQVLEPFDTATTHRPVIPTPTPTPQVLEPFDTATTHRPLAMGWCGKDSLVLYWRGMGLLMVGPYGDYIHFAYKDAIALVAEPDSCRIGMWG